jgi:hypothetical protein
MDTPVQIDPIYTTMTANSPIELGTYRVTLLQGDQRGPESDGDFSLRLSPSPRLMCAMHFSSYIPADQITAAEIPGLSARFATLPPDVTYTPSGTDLTLHPNPHRIEIFRANSSKLKEVTFHVMNFYNFHHGNKDFILQTDTSVRRLGRVLLQEAGWRLTIHALPETDNLVRELRSEGGYAITHVGRIARARRGSFTVNEAKMLLEILRLYLSFARGSFVSCSVAVGYDNTNVSWEQWSCPIIYRWQYYSGWFSAEPGRLLEELFPGFFALFKNVLWRKSLREVLYWYLRANNTSAGAGVDGGVILAQAALEKLGWAYLVDDVQAVTAAAFKSRAWPAVRKITELMTHMHIPIEIPAQLRGLNRVAKMYGWANGPAALVGIRNDLVHAERKYKRGYGNPLADAWFLAQRYIEMVILHLANYNGHYTDRISAKWVGEITKVPWA